MIARSLSRGFVGVFSFPHPVNEVAARMVAGMVVLLSLAIIAFDLPWLLFVLVYGFLARVLTGPTLSPMGLLATRVLVPLLGRTRHGPSPVLPSGLPRRSGWGSPPYRWSCFTPSA